WIDDRGPRRRDREPRHRRAGGRSLMQSLADWLLTQGFLRGMPTEVGYALVVAFFAFVLLNFIMIIAGVTSWLERRVWARIQSRIGPNRVGPQGVIQWLADGIKNVLKEDIVPEQADRRLFKLAPYLAMMGFFGTFAVVPFGDGLIVA